MSDFGRKPVSDKVSEAVKPDSEKSYAEQAKNKFTGAADDVAKDVQPNEGKSNTQKTADKGESLFDQTKDFVADKANKASEYFDSSKK